MVASTIVLCVKVSTYLHSAIERRSYSRRKFAATIQRHREATDANDDLDAVRVWRSVASAMDARRAVRQSSDRELRNLREELEARAGC